MSAGKTEASIYQQAEDGKTELSLMHFAITNPRWQPPRESTAFLGRLKEKVHRDSNGALAQLAALPDNALFCSIQSLQSESEPHSLIANVIAGPSALAHHVGRDLPVARHVSAASEVASALQSLSPQQASLQRQSIFQMSDASNERSRPQPSCGMVGSSVDVRTASSGSSAWEGQLQSLVLSEYASTEMSLHALYMHELHKQHARSCMPERHVWHREDSDESGESLHEDTEAQKGTPTAIPRSASYPFASKNPAEESRGLQAGFQQKYGGITDPGIVHRPPAHLSRQPLGGWADDGQTSTTRHPETVPEEGSEDELPPHVQKV